MAGSDESAPPAYTGPTQLETNAPPYKGHMTPNNTAGLPLSAASYLSTRPAPTTRAGRTVVHNFVITPGTAASALQFPKPEQVWMSRDVDREDWKTFLNYLIPKRPVRNASAFQGDFNIQDGAESQNSGVIQETEAARRRRINHLVAEWNDEFFQPRGLKVQPQFDPADAPIAESSKQGSGFISGKEGFGFKVGGSLVGIGLSVPSNSSSFGIRLGNVVLGVSGR